MLTAIGNQYRKPNGFLGKIISALMKQGNGFAYEKLIQILDIKDNESLFEIGYGPGIGIESIMSTTHCRISGIDYAELMFKEATKRNKKYIEQNMVALHLGDFLNFDIEPAGFDKIFCTNVIYFWDNLAKPFSIIRKGLKEKGQFCFYMAHLDALNKLKFTKDDIFNKYTIEEVVENLKYSGFSNIDYQFERGYFVRCEK